MKNICFVRQDKEAEKIHVALDVEQIIGRGPLLNCTDKRVSRNHGLLKLSDTGNIVITSTHANPIFYKEKGNSLIPVVSGKSVILHDGDEFALLPDCYKFLVVLPQQENGISDVNDVDEPGESHLNNKINVKEEVELSKEKQEMIVKPEPGNSDIREAKPECVEPIKVKQEQPDSIDTRAMIEQQACSNRKRKLPSWMLNPKNEESKNSKKTKERKSPQKKKNEKKDVEVAGKKLRGKSKIDDENDNASGSTSENKVLLPTKPHEMSEDEEENNDGEKEDKKGDIDKKTSNNEKERKSPQKRKNEKKDVEAAKKKIKGKSKIDDDEDIDDNESGNNSKNKVLLPTKQHEMSEDEESNDGEKEDKKGDIDKEDESDDQSALSVVQGAVNVQRPGNAHKRQKCVYGVNCYRKNPQHRIDFSHAGDPDFEDKNLPECPFGTGCYRKNKQHRLDFKHTLRPPRMHKKQKVTPAAAYDDDDDDDDDYDYDDPFLNDGSSDDYQPTDSDTDYSAANSSEDEEDTRRMVKEAKRFTRKKK